MPSIATGMSLWGWPVDREQDYLSRVQEIVDVRDELAVLTDCAACGREGVYNPRTATVAHSKNASPCAARWPGQSPREGRPVLRTGARAPQTPGRRAA